MGEPGPEDSDFWIDDAGYFINGRWHKGDFITPGACDDGLFEPVYAGFFGWQLRTMLSGFENCVPGNAMNLLGGQPWNTLIITAIEGPFFPH